MNLLKWNVFDLVSKEKIYEDDADSASVVHGLEASPLRIHMEFNVIF